MKALVCISAYIIYICEVLCFVQLLGVCFSINYAGDAQQIYLCDINN